MAHAKVSQETVDAAKASLLEVLHDGDTVYTILRSISRSGMSRRIDLYKLSGTPHLSQSGAFKSVDIVPLWLSNNTSMLLDDKHLKGNDGIRVDGCGMDMGFHLVDQLGQALGIKLIQRWL